MQTVTMFAISAATLFLAATALARRGLGAGNGWAAGSWTGAATDIPWRCSRPSR